MALTVLENHKHRQIPTAPLLAGKSDPDPSDLFGRKLFTCPVVKLGGSGRFVIGDGLRMFKCAAVLEVGGDASGPRVWQQVE